jgi:exodeoxyribonuclease VII small subunit
MKDKDKDLNFEKALADLERIVEKLEKGGLSLNESLGLFEKGVVLARFLRRELDKAEKKVEILLKDEKGVVKAAPFDLEDAESGSGAGEDSGAVGGDETGEGGTRQRSKPKKGDDDSELPF